MGYLPPQVLSEPSASALLWSWWYADRGGLHWDVLWWLFCPEQLRDKSSRGKRMLMAAAADPAEGVGCKKVNQEVTGDAKGAKGVWSKGNILWIYLRLCSPGCHLVRACEASVGRNLLGASPLSRACLRALFSLQFMCRGCGSVWLTWSKVWLFRTSGTLLL